MSFDGLFTKAMVFELKNLLQGGRINKIHHPFKNEIVLNIRSQGKNHKLLLSAHPSYARIQITNEAYENPKEPSMFCMMMRKHLEGAIMEDIQQIDLDRIVIFHLKGKNEIGDISYKQLIIEIMGRHSNIILIDKEKAMILDSIKHIPAAVNSFRTILPGQKYVFPPAQNKANPLEATEDEIKKNIDFNNGKLDRQLVNRFSGLSPLFAKEIVHRSGLANQETLPKAFLQAIQPFKRQQFNPTIVDTGTKEVFYISEIAHLNGEKRSFHSINEMLDRFYFGKAERDRVKQQAHDLERLIKNELEKNQSKLKKLRKTLEEAKNADHFKLSGELLTANLYAVKKGMEAIEVVNYYDENGAIMTIPLNPQKTPSENAQIYFSKYQKAKNAQGIVQQQIEKTHEEIDYFDHILQQLESASPKDIEEIREELAEEGYIKIKVQKRRKKPNDKPVLETYLSSDGTLIFVGKNNKQNDYLTNKFARRDEIWLHTKDIPGSHVVIRNEDPTEQTILEAANLAAYFSKAKHSSSVPVDFTKVRHVKKPSGSKPGFVIYENQQTIYVTPNPDTVIQMKHE
ncbi:Rqc2 family fibronectin-binding protein [Oikeobacillus pervagus]|nr:NFACT RNA binding domain-containing protein [Oikeobacillus pervagus]